MTPRPVAFAICLGATLLASGAWAQQAETQKPPAKPQTTEEMSLESLLNTPIEVSSTGTETIFQTTSTVSVIDADTIRQFNLRSVAEAVNTLAGVQVLRTHIMRNLPTFRGILEEHYANKVLVMIDGVAQWSAVTGEPNLDRVDINDVERIEVLKGPASVLYGTNAYTGAINVITKRRQQAPLEGHLEVGSRGLLGGGAHLGWGSGRSSFLVAANSSAESGYNETFVDEHGESGHLQEFLHGSNVTAVAQHGDHSFLFNASSVTDSYLGTTPEWALGIGHPQIMRGYLANYGYSHVFGKTTLRSSVSYDWTQRDFSRSRDDLTRSKVEGYRVTPSINATYKASDALSLDGGIDYDYRHSNSYSNYDVHKDVVLANNNMNGRHVYESSLFAQAAYNHGRLRLLGGTRYTNNQIFGSNLSSRGTAVFSIDPANAVKAIVGQSYRAPSLFELYFQTPTNTTYGNLDLEPETSTSYELAYLTRHGNLFAQALGYHAVYDNKIFRTRRFPASATDKSTIYINGASFDANGIELEAKYQLPASVNAFLNYGYVHGSQGDRVAAEDHYNFKYIPKNTAALGLAKTVHRWLLSAVVNYIGSTRGPLAPIPSQTTVDLNVGYTHTLTVASLTLRHKLSVKNLTDEEVLFPEYVRRNINAIPSGYRRQIVYTLQITGLR